METNKQYALTLSINDEGVKLMTVWKDTKSARDEKDKLVKTIAIANTANGTFLDVNDSDDMTKIYLRDYNSGGSIIVIIQITELVTV